MSIIIEALEEKRERVQEELYNAEAEVKNHPKYVKEVNERLSTLQLLLMNIDVAQVTHKSLPKTWWVDGHTTNGNMEKPLMDAWHAANKNIFATKKESENLSQRLSSCMTRVANLKDEIEEINAEIEKQKKS